LLGLGAIAAGGSARAMPAAAPFSYWDVWVDGHGGTHQARCAVRDFSPFSLGKGIEPIYVDKTGQRPGAVWIAQFPAGWVGAWHENPKQQWVIPLSGRWFVETTDGTRVEMGPGEASFGGDQGAKPDARGHVGHLSGTLGDAPITLMFVQGAAPAADGAHCRFR
jgi:hypothetical protein